jgi:hypothetical protein
MCSFDMYWRVGDKEELKEQILEEILYEEVVTDIEKSTIA